MTGATDTRAKAIDPSARPAMSQSTPRLRRLARNKSHTASAVQKVTITVSCSAVSCIT